MSAVVGWVSDAGGEDPGTEAVEAQARACHKGGHDKRSVLLLAQK